MFEALTITSDSYLYILFVVGLVSGLVGAMGGSGGLIITPFMVLTGVPPIAAVASMRVASVGMWGVAILKFKEADSIRWDHVLPITLCCLAGGLIGVQFALTIDAEAFRSI